mmetsp:Transcript_42935/g.128888  ORF Transcript_42935/g.128888 Transcript_42935/m.128888 type:complete len:418 (+) Transcript_42935:1030-2283(+)
MRRPHADRGALHALEQNGGAALLDLHHGPARLKAPGRVVHKARLAQVGQRLALRRGHPSQQRHELAAIANAQRPGVFTRIELAKLVEHALVEADGAGPALGRVERVGVREASHEDDSAERVQAGAPVDQVRHRDVPRLHSACKRRRRHLAVAVGALLADDGHAHLIRRLELCLGGKLRLVWQGPLWRGARRLHRLLGVDTLLGTLQPLQRKRRRLPHVAHRRGLARHRDIAGDRDGDVRSRRCLANHRRGDASGGVLSRDGVGLARRHLQDEAELLGEERSKHVVRVGRRRRQVGHHATVAGKRHLHERRHDATVADVVASCDDALIDERLCRLPHALEGCGRDVRRVVADLAVRLRERRATEASAPSAEVDVHQRATVTQLQVWSHHLGDVGAAHVCRDHQVAWRHNHLAARRRRH